MISSEEAFKIGNHPQAEQAFRDLQACIERQGGIDPATPELNEARVRVLIALGIDGVCPAAAARLVENKSVMIAFNGVYVGEHEFAKDPSDQWKDHIEKMRAQLVLQALEGLHGPKRPREEEPDPQDSKEARVDLTGEACEDRVDLTADTDDDDDEQAQLDEAIRRSLLDQ
jgi:hypothetical protein